MITEDTMKTRYASNSHDKVPCTTASMVAMFYCVGKSLGTAPGGGSKGAQKA